MSIVYYTFLPTIIANAEVASSNHFHEVRRLSATVNNLKSERVLGDFIIFLSQGDGKIGAMKMDAEHNYKDAKIVQVQYAGKVPCEERFYGNWIVVSFREESFINIYKFNPDGPDYLTLFQQLSIGGNGAMKFFLDANRGIMVTPNESSDNYSVIDLKPLQKEIPEPAELLTVTPLLSGAHPSRIVGVTTRNKDQQNMFVVIAIDAWLDKVEAIDVTDPKEPKRLGIFPTGPSPYFGDGNGNVFLIDSQNGDYLTVLDTTDLTNIHLLDSGSRIFVGNSSFSVQFIGENRDYAIWGIQGKDFSSDTNAMGQLDVLDLTDYHHIKLSKVLTAGRGCGRTEVDRTIEDVEAGLPAQKAICVNSPEGSISWYDISNPEDVQFMYNTYVAGGETHYTKFSNDGHHAVTSDRVNDMFVLYSDLEDSASLTYPLGLDSMLGID